MTLFIVISIALAAAFAMAGILIWSIAVPSRRLWPPRQSTTGNRIGVWLLTITIFAGALILGVLDWNSLGWPAVLRWSLGLPLIAAGHLVVWRGAFALGLGTTSGAAGALKTDGLYRHSRNPQYVADMAILIGYGILCASIWALPGIVCGVVILAIAPFAEEPWLSAIYGEAYKSYRERTPRYF